MSTPSRRITRVGEPALGDDRGSVQIAKHAPQRLVQRDVRDA